MFENFFGTERPLSWTFKFWPVIVLAFLCSLAATWLCKKIALRFGIVDRPDDKVKTHKKPVAYLGGVGIFIGFTVGVLAGIYCLVGQDSFREATVWLAGIFAGAAIACFVGVVDDIFELSPAKKVLGQIIAALTLVIVGITPALRYLAGYLGWQVPGSVELALGAIVVIFFVLAATNSLNLLDGLDGLCGGVTVVIAIGQLLLAIYLSTWGFSQTGDPVRIIICLAVIGGVCGFLPFNRYPARIFMGDAGSVMLGFTMAALMILFAENVPRWWMASVVIFGLPILDTGTALVRRIVNRRPLFVSDRGHIYDQMIDRGIPLNRTVAICYGLAAVYALIGVALSQVRTRYALIGYVVVFAVSALVIWRMGFLEMEGLRGARRKTVSGSGKN